MRLLALLGSLKFALIILGVLALMVAALYLSEISSSAPLAVPFGLLSANLLAAITINPLFRRQTTLLIFHLALLGLVLLLAASRLTYLKGSVELTEGEQFEGRLVAQEAGPFHSMQTLEQIRFSNLGFQIDYAPGPLRQGIRNTIEIMGKGGVPLQVEISDQKPLIISNYRFYPTGNKGFAPTFLWRPAAGGPPIIGSVHLPSYPLHEYGQAREWTPPGTQLHLWTLLEFDEVILAPDRRSEFRPPKQHRIVVRSGERRWELTPGGAVFLPEGHLEYQGLRGWMGYTVFYDWTIPWLLATCLVSVGALGAHFWFKFTAIPWNEKNP